MLPAVSPRLPTVPGPHDLRRSLSLSAPLQESCDPVQKQRRNSAPCLVTSSLSLQQPSSSNDERTQMKPRRSSAPGAFQGEYGYVVIIFKVLRHIIDK